MALHFKESTKILLGQDVFMSVNVINGKVKLTLYKARRIPSITYPHRTICVPGPSGICIDYEQYIHLVEKAPLLVSIISSIKDYSDKEKKCDFQQKLENSDGEKTECEIQQKLSSLRSRLKRPRRCNDKTISNELTVRKLDGDSNFQRKSGSEPETLPIEDHAVEPKNKNQRASKDIHSVDTIFDQPIRSVGTSELKPSNQER